MKNLSFIFVSGLLSVLLHAAEVVPQGRMVFYRGEKDAVVTVKVSGISSCRLTVASPTGQAKNFTVNSDKVKIPLDTNLIPGKYQLRWNSGSDSGSIDFTIGPEYFTGFPICIWGDGFVSHRLYQSHGFTHAMRYRSTRYLLRTEQKFYDMDTQELDESLADGFIHGDTFDIGCARWGFAAELKAKYPRISRYNSKLSGNINILDPQARHDLENAAFYPSKKLGSHPAYGIMNINSEVRDSTMPSFSKHDKKAWKKYSGMDIPELVNNKYAPYYTEIPGFPASRIVPDDDPLLKYYVWFWKHGDGWNEMNSRISQIYHRRIKHPFITVFDPAVRCPPIWGNGGNVDVLQHWTYVNPDPIRVIAAIDEVRAMAAEKKQKVDGMGQLFVYREHVAPAAAEKEYPSGRFDAIKNERYITTPPDMLRELIWAMMFRQIHGMMFHGTGTMFPMPQKGKYTLALPGTEKQLADTLLNQVKPLAPLVSTLPDRPARIAVFQSIASAIFAGRGSQGNESWPYVLHRILQYGGFDPHMIYEEQLLRDGWGEIKVLLLPHCDVLSASALKKLQEFQKAGGIIIADEFLMPALMPDLRLNSRTLMNGMSDKELTAAEKSVNPGNIAPKELSRKANLQRTGRQLAQKLLPFIQPLCSADDPDIITSSRSGGSGDYIFAVNDKRTYGDYLGIYGRIMEKGLPNSGKISISRPAAVVYNCLTGEETAAEFFKEQTVIPVSFTTNDGKALLLLNEKIGKVEISAPETASPGTVLDYQIRITGTSGKAVSCVLPFRMTVTYADGRVADIPEYAVTAQDGRYQSRISLPGNTPAGELIISVTTLPGKISGTAKITIK